MWLLHESYGLWPDWNMAASVQPHTMPLSGTVQRPRPEHQLKPHAGPLCSQLPHAHTHCTHQSPLSVPFKDHFRFTLLMYSTFLSFFFYSLFTFRFLFLFRAHPTALDGSSRATELQATRSFPRDPKYYMYQCRLMDSSSTVRRLSQPDSSVGFWLSGRRLPAIPAHLLLHRGTAESPRLRFRSSFVLISLFVCFPSHFQFLVVSFALYLFRSLCRPAF